MPERGDGQTTLAMPERSNGQTTLAFNGHCQSVQSRERDLQNQPPTIRACGGPGVRVAAGATSLARQGRAAQIQVRQLAWVVDGLATPENWLVSHTTPVLVVAGLGSGVAPE